MEDRHYLSDPRPIHGLKLPTWEVDIMREGVDVPIMTITIDSTNLPPRKSKKKVVWKLPDDVEMLPKFGILDRKRIMEMYKEKKKEVKRLSKRRASEKSLSSLSPPQSRENFAGQADLSTPPLEFDSLRLDNSQDRNSNWTHPNPPDSPDEISHESNRMQLSMSSYSSPPPGLEKLSLGTNSSTPSKKPIYGVETRGISQPLALHQPLNDIGSMPQAPLAPSRIRPLAPPPGISIQDPSSRLFLTNHTSYDPHTTRSELQQQQHQFLMEARLQLSYNGQSLPSQAPFQNPVQQPPPYHLPILSSEGRCFVPPPELSKPSTFAALANLVTETYYLLLHRRLISELASYYIHDAQKSLMVGGAYAACATAAERLLQLQSLAGAIKPLIKGVFNQPTLAGGVMIMITGISVRPPAGLLLPFCHTMILTPVMRAITTIAMHEDTTTTATSEGLRSQPMIGYQIQNDNLVFFTGDDTSSNGNSTLSESSTAFNGTTNSTSPT